MRCVHTSWDNCTMWSHESSVMRIEAKMLLPFPKIMTKGLLSSRFATSGAVMSLGQCLLHVY
jgi:hypothetical protein